MKTIKREDIKEHDFLEILKKESHHEHEIIEDEHGTLRWKEDPTVRKIIDKGILNDLWYLFHTMGMDKNSEHIRKLYRDMGYSLSGYWEIFYWEVNNPIAKKYKGKKLK